MHFYTKAANRHGGESGSYQARVIRSPSGEVVVELAWPTKHGGTQHGELALESDAARWLAFALLKAVEEQGESAIEVEEGIRQR